MAEVNPAGLMFGPKRISERTPVTDVPHRERLNRAAAPARRQVAEHRPARRARPRRRRRHRDKPLHALDKYPDLTTTWIEL
jgi:hypothetical protein